MPVADAEGPTPATVTAYGESALLLEVHDPDDLACAVAVAGWLAALERDRPPGVLDLVPAARSVLLLLDRRADVARVRDELAALHPSAPTARRAPWSRADPETAGVVVRVPTVYDGEDLDLVGRVTGLGREGVVAAHTAVEWQVAFSGFAPGFAYLVSPDGRLTVPRRDTPRPRVPAGAVALAAGYCAVYPRPSPGGWLLLGHTSLPLWDLSADPPAVLRPGGRVRFVEVLG